MLKTICDKLFLSRNKNIKANTLDPKSWDELLEIDEGAYNFLGTDMNKDQAGIFIRNISLVAVGGLGLVMIGVFAYGSFLWITAGDNEEKVQKGRKVAMGGLVGLGIVVGFLALLGIISNIIGVNISNVTLDFLDNLL